MDLTENDVLEIMKLFESSKFDYLQLEHDGRKIILSKAGNAPIAVSTVSPAPLLEQEPPATLAAQAGSQTPNAEPEVAATAVAVADEGLTAVPAPMVGKFYAAPSPSDPPFVEVGQRVEPDTTMGLIEVMKVFNSITAGFDGTVEKILVSNGQAVQEGQPLFLIRQKD